MTPARVQYNEHLLDSASFFLTLYYDRMIVIIHYSEIDPLYAYRTHIYTYLWMRL